MNRQAFPYPLVLLMLVAAVVGCNDDSKSPTPSAITETGFLEPCSASSECASDLACVCGSCTHPCSADNECGSGLCATTLASSSCLQGLTACLPGCVDDGECGPTGVCSNSLCIAADLIDTSNNPNNIVQPHVTVGMSCDELNCDDGEACTDDSCEQLHHKVVVVLDQSASLQCMDSDSRRSAVLSSTADKLLELPNTDLAFVGFSSWVREQPFTRSRENMDAFLDPAAGLGPAADYQGALATARLMVEDDIAANPGEGATTEYEILFLSDGVPAPRCNAGCEDTITDCSDGADNDGDGATDGADDDCANIDDNTLHPDNLYGLCNTDLDALDPPLDDELYVEFPGDCPEYNSDSQILGEVEALKALEQTRGVRRVTVSTYFLYSPREVVEAICTSQVDKLLGADRESARTLLSAMAGAGGGQYVDVNLTAAGDVIELSEYRFACVNTATAACGQ